MTPTAQEYERRKFEEFASKFKGTRDEFNLERNAKGEYVWSVADMVWRAWNTRAQQPAKVSLDSMANVLAKELDPKYNTLGVSLPFYDAAKKFLDILGVRYE